MVILGLDLTDDVEQFLLLGMFPVGKVESENVGAGEEELLNHFERRRSRAEGGQLLGLLAPTLAGLEVVRLLLRCGCRHSGWGETAGRRGGRGGRVCRGRTSANRTGRTGEGVKVGALQGSINVDIEVGPSKAGKGQDRARQRSEKVDARDPHSC